MTLHIKRAIAAMTAVLMLLTLVPTAALPTIQLPDLSAPSDTVDAPATNADAAPLTDADEDDAPANNAAATPSTDAPANNAAATPSTDAPANNAAATPSTDAPANNAAATPSTDAPANNAATAPSTDAPANNAAATPSTDAPANNVVETVVTDPEIIEDVLASEDGIVMGDDNTVYTDIDNDGDIEAIKGDAIEDDDDFDPSETIQDLLAGVEQGREEAPEYLDAEENAAAHASPYQPLYTNDDSDPFLPGGDAYIDQDSIYYGAPATPTYPFTDWAANTSFLNTSVKRYDDNGRALEYVFPDVDLIDINTFGDDATDPAKTNQNGKQGHAYNRYDAAYGKYGITIDRNSKVVEWEVGKDVYLSETPYLAFSVEQIDSAKLAIAVRIGTPTTPGGSEYTYRWYTITDNNNHLGIDHEETKRNTVQPSVQISTDDPIFNPAAFTAGALTGCIDMVYWLPQINTDNTKNVRYKIDKVQVSSAGEPARINYLYFLNQASTIISPQINTGAVDLGTAPNPTDASAYASADDLNGWRNSDAVSIEMIGESNYRMTIDSSTDGVRTYTHRNDNHAQFNGTYFDVVIPVRKWLNFSADSRTVLVEMYNNEATEDSSKRSGHKELEFSLWGNNTGGTPMHYLDNNNPALFHSHAQREDILFITGHSGNDICQPYCYGSPENARAQTLQIDQKYNSNYAYNKTNLFDFIQSPYMKSAVYVADPDDDKYGWAYVSSMRITVPVDSGIYKISAVQTRPVEDGLNDFSKNSAGEMVPDENSYDGGTGVQPVVDPAKTSTEPAAFGPHYYSSEYSITDLLNHSDVNSDDNHYNNTSEIYGATARYLYTYWTESGNKTDSSVDINIYDIPDHANGRTIGYLDADGADKYVTVYAKATTTSTWNEPFYAIPFINSDGLGITWGWISGSHLYSESGNWLDSHEEEDLKDFGSFTSSDIASTFPKSTWVNELYMYMQDKWVWSNLIESGNSTWKYLPAKTAVKVSNNEYAPVPVAYTSVRYDRSFNGSNITYRDMWKMGTWETDFLLTTYPENNEGYVNINTNRIRILKDPIYVDKNDYLYVDAHISGANTVQLLFADANGKIYTFRTDVANKNFFGFSNGSGPDLPTGSVSARIPFESVFTVLSGVDGVELFSPKDSITGTNPRLQLIGVAMGFYGDDGAKHSCTWRRLEVHSKMMEYKDRIEKRETKDEDGVVTKTEYVDGFNILEDACNETYTNRDGFTQTVRGRRGWKIRSSYSSDFSSFEFRPTLGHYRVKKGFAETGQLVLDSTHSFGVNDYKYLYLSFSMRNTTNNYGLEPMSTGNGISVALKQYEGENVRALLLDKDTKSFVLNTDYVPADVTREYLPSLNIAVDLSQTGLNSLSQIEFNFNGPANTYFYINYLYLSNVPPTPGFEERVVNRGFYHNYYLMDNTKGRYARRFPTVANPSGQITERDTETRDENGVLTAITPSVNGRVNPLIIERGQQFWTGTYYNGTPLNSYTYNNGTSNVIETDTQDVYSTVFFYQDNTPDLNTDGDEELEGEHLIDQYYKLGESEALEGQYDAYWCYNRWPVGWGKERYAGYDKDEHTTEGPLMDLHATANQVFLRNGIDPIKYLTIFDTQGGQMVYRGSSEINTDQNGLIENETNRYITNAIMTDYFNWPTSEGIGYVNPEKYGYTFRGWFTHRDGEGYDNEQLQRWHTKINPGDRTFYARWDKDEDVSKATVNFVKAVGDTETWLDGVVNDDHTMVIPKVTQIRNADGTQVLYGWKVQGDTSGKVYTPGMKLTVTKDITFEPVTDENKGEFTPVTVKVTGGNKLYAYRGEGVAPAEIINRYKGIAVSDDGNGVTTYTNIPRFMVVVAKPTNSNDSYAWTMTDSGSESLMITGEKVINPVVSYDTEYRFAVSGDVTLNYVPVSAKAASGALVVTSPKAIASNRQMMFYTQFDLPEGAEALSYGTLYTKDSQYNNIVGNATTDAEIGAAFDAKMRFATNECLVTEDASAVRFFKATEKNATNQFYLMVTENKGNAVMYYARGYVQYTYNGETLVAYSDVISTASVQANAAMAGN